MELKTLFISPVAWLVLIVFLIQTGLGYMDKLTTFQRAGVTAYKIPGITMSIFTGEQGFFTDVQAQLYLYLPLLTMGLMSREISSGSIKLLLSSPVTIGEIIAGKLAAILCFCGLLALILAVYVLITVIYLPFADIGLMCSGLLGIFLMATVYSAIGLFMSSLTAYQPIAALGTFGVLATLNMIGSVGQNIDLVRTAASFLAINGRTEQMIGGLITTRQLAYFLIMAGLFTGLTIIRLNGERRPRPLGIRLVSYTVPVLMALGLEWLAARPALTEYWDLTATKSQTVTPESQAILKTMPPLTVHTYVNLLGYKAEQGLPENRNDDLNFYDRYQRFLRHDIHVDYTYYYDSCPDVTGYKPYHGIPLEDLAENFADNKDLDMKAVLDPAAIRRRIDLRPRHNEFTRQLVAAGRSSMIGLFGGFDHNPGEEEMLDALKLLTVPKQEVAFLTGHNERVALDNGRKDRDYNQRMNTLGKKQSMINHGFAFRELRIDTADVPADVSLLIIADPTLPLSAAELTRVQRYIAGGRDLWVMGEPARKALLEPIIRPLGVRFMDGMLLRDAGDKDYTPDFLITYVTPEAKGYSRVMQQLFDDSSQMPTRSGCGLLFDSSGPFRIEPLLVTDSNHTWNHRGPYDTAAQKIAYDPAAGDRKGAYPIAVTLRRNVHGREQRIMVFGDADMMSDDAFSGVPKKLWELDGELFKWFSHGLFPEDIYHPTRPDKLLTIGTGEFKWLKIILLFLLPAVLFVWGGMYLLRRRRI